MSEAVEKLREQAIAQLKEAGVSKIDNSKLDTIVDRLKTIAGNRDAIYVAGTDSAELETVRKNFAEKHCGVSDKDKGAAAVSAVAEQMGGAGIKMKNRAAFYYLVQEKLG
jgi:mevalonate pyrophosphate decarboxylase